MTDHFQGITEVTKKVSLLDPLSSLPAWFYDCQRLDVDLRFSSTDFPSSDKSERKEKGGGVGTWPAPGSPPGQSSGGKEG